MPHHADPTPIATRLTTEQAAKVRQKIATRARVPVESLTPQTNVVRDLGIGGMSLGMLLSLLDAEFGIKTLPVLKKIQTGLDLDPAGRLTNKSRDALAALLPGFDLEGAKPTSLDDVLTVAGLEAVVAKLVGARPADLPVAPIWSVEQQEWVAKLPAELGERKFRLLLAGALRQAFAGPDALEPEVADALQILERFADTGKSKQALRGLRKKYRDDWGQVGRVLPRSLPHKGLYEALTPDDPTLAVIPVTVAMCAGRKLSDVEGVRELRRLHADLVTPSTAGAFADEWRTPKVIALAQSMVDSRVYQKMAPLADALEHAGCKNPAVLGHCRAAQAVHIRGCWVLDAVLGF
jgi:hypothetical protein